MTRPKRTRIAGQIALFLAEQQLLRGMTKKDFAELVGCSTPYLYAVLAGTGNPTIDTVAGWAERLGVECEVRFVEPEGRAHR